MITKSRDEIRAQFKVIDIDPPIALQHADGRSGFIVEQFNDGEFYGVIFDGDDEVKYIEGDAESEVVKKDIH